MLNYKLTRLNMDLRYFPERKQTEHWQLIFVAFLVTAWHNWTIVYGTRGSAINVKIKMGKSALFSSDAAIMNL